MAVDRPPLPTDVEWRRSSAAGPGAAVEIAILPGDGGVFLRTTTSTAQGVPPLHYTPDEWDAFLAGVRAGEFDEP